MTSIIRQMTHIMVDIETLAVSPKAVISTIGAVRFDPRDKNLDIKKLDRFYSRVDHESCIRAGLVVDPDTMEWWRNQPGDVSKEIWESSDRANISAVLKKFSKWCDRKKIDCVWAQGSHFDIPILENAYGAVGISPPWKFWQIRDSRTLMDATGASRPFLYSDMKHHSMYDAFRQAVGVQSGYEIIGKINKKDSIGSIK